MFRALNCLSSGGLRRNCIYAASGTKNTWNNTKIRKSAGGCPVFVGYILAFALQLREKHGKTSVRVVINKHTMRIVAITIKIHELHY
jgi:hypothetical protein